MRLKPFILFCDEKFIVFSRDVIFNDLVMVYGKQSRLEGNLYIFEYDEDNWGSAWRSAPWSSFSSYISNGINDHRRMAQKMMDAADNMGIAYDQ